MLGHVPGPSRRQLGVIAWLAATAAATAVGLFAVGAIGAGIVDQQAPVLTPDQVNALLAAEPSPAPPGPTTVPGPGGQAEVLAGRGGTVVARCAGGAAEIVSTSPAQGFRVDDDDRLRGEVKFESEGLDVTMQVSCAEGRPVAHEQAKVDD